MQTFLAAAEILAHGGPGDPAAASLLAQLGYDDGRSEAVPHRVAMLRAAGAFRRIFTLASPDAPGLTVLGATADAEIAVSGAGTTFRDAFEACVGEGVEALSRCALPGQEVARLAIDEALADATPAWRSVWEGLQPYRRHPSAREIDWVRAVDLSDGSGVWVPADLCLRRTLPARQIDPPWPLSTGCAAAPDRAAATLAGLLELVERDAVALWWRGGRRARLLAPNAAATSGGGGAPRPTARRRGGAPYLAARHHFRPGGADHRRRVLRPGRSGRLLRHGGPPDACGGGLPGRRGTLPDGSGGPACAGEAGGGRRECAERHGPPPPAPVSPVSAWRTARPCIRSRRRHRHATSPPLTRSRRSAPFGRGWPPPGWPPAPWT